MVLARSFLIRCLSPETAKSLSAINKSGNVGGLWSAIMNKCSSTNTETRREIYRQVIKIQETSREDIRDAKIPIELQNKIGNLGIALQAAKKKKRKF